jgi:hypothetical protein
MSCALTPGARVFCVAAVDDAGNESKGTHCSTITVT